MSKYTMSSGGGGGVVVSALNFRSEGRWFDAQSLPSCCFLSQETLPHFVFSTQVEKTKWGTAGGNPAMN